MSDLTPQQQLNLGLSSHNNNYLFSNHYLDNILKADNWGKTWAEAKQHGRDLLTFLQPLYQQEKANLANYSESQLEEHWFKPILTYLGHTYEGQAKIPALGRGVKYPDYVFFPDDATRQTAVSAQQTDAYTNDALALGEVKKWGISLDRKLTSGQVNFNDNNPMYQIDYYLRATGLTWGILSNGRVWRLLHKDSSYKLDVYFELDLEQALLQADTTSGQAIAAFFVLFFQQASFRPDAQGRTFLQEALTASTRYAQELEEDLRDNAYRALEHLIQGFIDPSRNNLTAVDLPQIYTSSLYLLYRIIFLFYGERRGLLPLQNPDYFDRSLGKLAKDIADQFDKGRNYPSTSRQLYARLSELFTIINGTDPDLNAYLGVPRYNGGLFNPDLHPFLADYYVGDGHLAQAINVLARREVADSKTAYHWENVDYRTLGVRQIGSIYEGLLEYKPRRATRDLVAVKKGKSETWLPVAEKPKKVSLSSSPTRQEGDIYLETDKGERKATGSYYTPDYIVKYIVEQTLTPLVAQAQARAEAQGVPLEAELLQLNVLDPAMGSGHFLVEATNFLARKLIEAGSENEADPSRETELIYWKRRVVEACIYGVDKNPMAVELAKLSLWLETVAAEKPLSFLDHHLRHGDSLVGARLADLRRAPGAREEAQAEGQKPLLDESAFTTAVNLAVGGMTRIETMLSETLEDVHTKEGIFHELQGHLTKWQQLADLWVSYYFGNSFTPQEYRALSAYVQGQTSSMGEKEAAHWLAHTAVTDNDYFHWELAFPEVFFDEHGRGLGDSAGFDAVVGNPPYVRQEELEKLDKAFFRTHFADVYAGTADLFIYFFKLALNLLCMEGRTSYISSNSWLRANYATSLRSFLRQHTTIETLIDLGDNQVFKDAPDLYPAIHVVIKAEPPTTHIAQAISFRRGELVDFQNQLAITLRNTTMHDQPDAGWQLEQNKRDLYRKIATHGKKLNEVVQGDIFYGIKTGFNEAFVIDRATRDMLIQQDPSSETIIKPMLRGADLRPWYQAFQEKYLIVIPAGWTREQFHKDLSEDDAWRCISEKLPAITQYLEPYTARAKKRQDQGDYWWELRSCDYYEAFDVPKIVWPGITKVPRFSLDLEGRMVNDACFFTTLSAASLLAVLQSRLTWFCISQICAPLGERAGLPRYQLKTQFIEHLPIPKMSQKDLQVLDQLALQMTQVAKSRQYLNEQIRNRIWTDFGRRESALNNALSAWWKLDFSSFRTQLKKVFKSEIPLKERHEWQGFLEDAQVQQKTLTMQIIQLETKINNIVYGLFQLTTEEIQLIEESTKYEYGAI